MKVGELQTELDRENPEDEVELWVMPEGRGYAISQIYAGEPGKVEIQAEEEITGDE